MRSTYEEYHDLKSSISKLKNQIELSCGQSVSDDQILNDASPRETHSKRGAGVSTVTTSTSTSAGGLSLLSKNNNIGVGTSSSSQIENRSRASSIDTLGSISSLQLGGYDKDKIEFTDILGKCVFIYYR